MVWILKLGNQKSAFSIVVHSFKNENELFNPFMTEAVIIWKPVHWFAPHYISAIGKFLPWIFAFDHVLFGSFESCARSLPIHHYDMEMLKETNPEIYQEYDDNGNFTVMVLDQCHEQLNKDVKGKSKVFKCSLFFNINGQPSKLFF